MLPDLAAVLSELDNAQLPAPVFRTGVRLALRAGGSRQIELTHGEMALLVGTQAIATVRSHLVQLHATGLLWYRSGHSTTSIAFRALSDQIDRSAINGSSESRALSDQSDRSAINSQSDIADVRSLSDQSDRSAINSRAERSKRALSDHPYIGIGREVGNKSLSPTYLPTDPQQARTYRLLVDPAVGMNEKTAAKLASQYTFENVLANVFAALADIKNGRCSNIYVLPHRLSQRRTPRIADADRASELYRRHVPEEDELRRQEDELRSRYVPAEYQDVIIH